jgi:hypothetical protein
MSAEEKFVGSATELMIQAGLAAAADATPTPITPTTATRENTNVAVILLERPLTPMRARFRPLMAMPAFERESCDALTAAFRDLTEPAPPQEEEEEEERNAVALKTFRKVVGMIT